MGKRQKETTAYRREGLEIIRENEKVSTQKRIDGKKIRRGVSIRGEDR